MEKDKENKNNFFKKEYRLSIENTDSNKKLISFSFNGRSFTLIGLVIIFMIFILSILICTTTPIKKIIPGFPTEKEKKEAIMYKFKIDSLDREIKLWEKQLMNIQLITTGNEPITIKSDSIFIEEKALKQAIEWKEKEKEVIKRVEQNNNSRNNGTN